MLCWEGVHCGIYKGSYNIPNISSQEGSFQMKKGEIQFRAAMGNMEDPLPPSGSEVISDKGTFHLKGL